jgi:hypothetical protein
MTFRYVSLVLILSVFSYATVAFVMSMNRSTYRSATRPAHPSVPPATQVVQRSGSPSLQAQAAIPDSASSHPDEASGIRGQVLRRVGNFMPGRARSGREEPVQTTVWIFQGSIPALAPHWAVAEAIAHPALLTQVATDAAGFFSVSLPPGTYTVLAQYDDYLYLNSFTAENEYTSVQVPSQGVAEVSLVNTEEATF